MKIVKRDGRVVDYDREKIRTAINKANQCVSIEEKIDNGKIDKIIEYIESLDKKRMLVEDIQDIIEMKLMEYGKYNLAKNYIIYRYKRSLIRKSNTTDASILSLLKNSSRDEENDISANRQRDLMAGEVSKDLAYRILLPSNVVSSIEENRTKFCNVEYFTEPIIENAKINLSDMFENGTVINGVKIESPKSFQSACNILVEIVASIASSQTGEIYIDIKDLFKYYYLSYEKKYATYKALMQSSFTNEQIRALVQTQTFLEIKSGIQTIFYQINTITLANGLTPKVYFLVDTSDITSEVEENLIYEFIRQKNVGIQDEEGTFHTVEYPEIIYSVPKDKSIYDRYDYITKELFASKGNYIVMNSCRYKSFTKELERFNQGSIIINLAGIALLSKRDNIDFNGLLNKTLSDCYEGFLCRNHNLQGTYTEKSPIHWMYGAISKLGKNERIDQYLKSDASYMKLSVIGFEAAVKILDDNPDIKTYIKKTITEQVNIWNKENTFSIVISNTYDVNVVNNMYENSKEELKKYGAESYFDSLEFMTSDYFDKGFIYLDIDKNIDDKDNIIENNYIIRKNS